MQNSPQHDMPDDALTNQIGRILDDARDLVSALDDAPDGRTARDTHRLRETVGVLLILSERLAQEEGNGSMVTLDNNGDGTGTASFTVSLEDGLDVGLTDN